MSELFHGGSPARRAAGYLLAFLAVLAVYAFAYWLDPRHALAVALAFATAVVVYFQRRWKPQIPSYDRQLADLSALVSLSPLRQEPVLPYSGMALDGLELSAVISDAMLDEPACIVECGSGVSTLMLGNVLRAREQGHLYALEEDASWCRLMQNLVRAAGLGQYVQVYHAPVVGEWYDTTVADHVRREAQRIDLLLVDGPQAKARQSRYQALPFFRECLTPQSTIMLHDVNRDAERNVLDRWQSEHGANVTEVIGGGLSARGLAKLRVPAEGAEK